MHRNVIKKCKICWEDAGVAGLVIDEGGRRGELGDGMIGEDRECGSTRGRSESDGGEDFEMGTGE